MSLSRQWLRRSLSFSPLFFPLLTNVTFRLAISMQNIVLIFYSLLSLSTFTRNVFSLFFGDNGNSSKILGEKKPEKSLSFRDLCVCVCVCVSVWVSYWIFSPIVTFPTVFHLLFQHSFFSGLLLLFGGCTFFCSFLFFVRIDLIYSSNRQWDLVRGERQKERRRKPAYRNRKKGIHHRHCLHLSFSPSPLLMLSKLASGTLFFLSLSLMF